VSNLSTPQDYYARVSDAAVSKYAVGFTKRRLQGNSESTKSAIEFDADETLGVFFAPNFPLDKSHFLVYILSP
jgi:hypothetical protein